MKNNLTIKIDGKKKINFEIEVSEVNGLDLIRNGEKILIQSGHYQVCMQVASEIEEILYKYYQPIEKVK